MTEITAQAESAALTESIAKTEVTAANTSSTMISTRSPKLRAWSA